MKCERNERGKTHNPENRRLCDYRQKRRACRANRSHKPFGRGDTEGKREESDYSAWRRKLRASHSPKIWHKRRLTRGRTESRVRRNPPCDDRSQRLGNGRASVAEHPWHHACF